VVTVRPQKYIIQSKNINFIDQLPVSNLSPAVTVHQRESVRAVQEFRVFGEVPAGVETADNRSVRVDGGGYVF